MRDDPNVLKRIFYPTHRYAKNVGFTSVVVVFLLVTVVTYFYISDPYRQFPGVGDMNFIFHEFGHIITQPFPFIIIAMGGTIFQLLLPTFATIYMYLRRRYLESALFFCWLGTNLSYVGIYMKDTILRTMPMSTLFGPDAIHDWEYIFREFRVELHAIEIGNTVLWIGQFIMIFSCVYVGFLLVYKFYLKLKGEEKKHF